MKDWKIGARMVVGFAVVIVISICLGLFAINRAAEIGRKTDQLGSNYLPAVMALSQLRSNVHQGVADLLALIDSSDPKTIETLNAEILRLREQNKEALAFYETTPFTPEEAAIYAEFKTTRAEFWRLFEETETAGKSTDKDGIAKARAIFVDKMRPQYVKYNEALQSLVAINKKGAELGMTSIRDAVSSTMRGVMIGLALSVAISIPIVLLIVRSITVPLGRTVSALEKLAANDLTVKLEIDSRDEIGTMGEALNRAIENIRTILLQVAESAGAASSSSQELSAAAGAISSGAQQQAASLEETSASLEQITATIRQSSDNAKQASVLASGGRGGKDGEERQASAVSAMEDINAASAKIADIISTVDEIAFQTNLLAVNAAVEAARAGEEGRGFAVVASEVRSLAQRSAAASKEIKGLIQNSLRKVETGSELVNRVTRLVSDIASAAKEQSAGVEQVNTAMTQMDQVTQSNAAQTEELSATAESLADQAGHLLELVATFKLGGDGGRSGRSAAPAPRSKADVRSPAKGARSVPAAKAAPFRTGGAKAKSSAIAAMTSAGGADDSSFEEF